MIGSVRSSKIESFEQIPHFFFILVSMKLKFFKTHVSQLRIFLILYQKLEPIFFRIMVSYTDRLF